VLLALLIQLQYFTKLANPKLKMVNATLFFLTGTFWQLQHMGVWQQFPMLYKILPRIVYIVSAGTIGIIYYTKNEGENAGPQHLKSTSIEILSFLILPIMLVTGLEGPFLALVFFVQINILISILVHIPSSDGLHISFIWGLLVLQYFFASGHSFDFNGVHWAAAFVGFEDVNWIVGGILMVLETWSSGVLLTAALPILVSYVNPPQQLGTVTIYYGFYLFFFQTNSFLTTLFVFFARRHLMVWRVFAPKFLFESGQLLLLDVLIMCSVGFVRKMLKPNVKTE
jgi:phosphatidylinositol glycan class O